MSDELPDCLRGVRVLRALAAGLIFALVGVAAVFLAPGSVPGPHQALLSSRSERLLPAPEVRRAGGTYAFTRTQPGHPDKAVAYDPCSPIRVVQNPALAPPDGPRMVEEAFAALSPRTGLRFELVGTTEERPEADRPASDPERYGEGWSPVLVAWSTPDEMPHLTGPVAGVAGSVAHGRRFGTQRYVTGSVVLDAPALTALRRAPHGEEHVRAVILHELGHLVGLDHVADPREMMSAQEHGLTAYGPGDREGLALLGRAPCHG